MKKFFNSQFWLVIVSIIFSILLFLTATTSNYTHVGSQVSGATETFTHTLTNVPIDIKYDSDKYFISGYSYETEVYLTSINRVKLTLKSIMTREVSRLLLTCQTWVKALKRYLLR